VVLPGSVRLLLLLLLRPQLPPGVPELLLQGGDRLAVTGLLRLVVGKGMVRKAAMTS